MKQNNSSAKIQDLCLIGLFVALICVLAQVSIPMPYGVPMTLQTFIIPLGGILLGARRGTIAALVYVLLGAVGVPVFAGFSGGLGIVFGVTGGFIISFPLMPLLAGIGAKHGSQPAMLLGLFGGALLNYIVGMLWYSAMTGNSLQMAFVACVLPFIPTALIKIALIDLIGARCRKLLLRAGALGA